RSSATPACGPLEGRAGQRRQTTGRSMTATLPTPSLAPPTSPPQPARLPPPAPGRRSATAVCIVLPSVLVGKATPLPAPRPLYGPNRVRGTVPLRCAGAPVGDIPRLPAVPGPSVELRAGTRTRTVYPYTRRHAPPVRSTGS